MSYTIEYDRQFIRSNTGFTPLWLAGDNNVYVSERKRAREWCVFGNLLGVSEQEMLAFIEPMLGGYNQHWMKNGKWVTDDGLKRWIQNGCKSAATIEEVLKANRMRCLRCSLHVYPKKDATHDGFTCEEHLKVGVSTTEEFDQWIANAKTAISGFKAQGATVYPYVQIYYAEKLNHPGKQTDAERVLVKQKRMYLVEPPTPSGSNWSSDIRKAWVFTREEADRMKADAGPYGYIAEAKLIDASAKDRPFNAVIRFADGPNAGMYVQQFTGRRARLAYNIEYAHHYPDTKAAERAMKTAQPKFLHSGTLETIIDPNTAQTNP